MFFFNCWIHTHTHTHTYNTPGILFIFEINIKILLKLLKYDSSYITNALKIHFMFILIMHEMFLFRWRILSTVSVVIIIYNWRKIRGRWLKSICFIYYYFNNVVFMRIIEKYYAQKKKKIDSSIKALKRFVSKLLTNLFRHQQRLEVWLIL